MAEDEDLPDFNADEPQMPTKEEVSDLCAYAFLDEVKDEEEPGVDADAAPEPEAIAAETIKNSFRAADSNGDGTIAPEELKSLFQYLGDWSDDDFESLMAAADKNEDGKLGYEEFVLWVMKSGTDSASLNMAPAYAQALAESSAAAEKQELEQRPAEPQDEYTTYLQASHEQAVVEYAEGTPESTINSFDELERCENLEIVTEMSLTPIGNFNMENDGKYTVDMLFKLKPFTADLSSLRKLILSDNQLGDAAMPALVSCLQCLPSLEVLELQWNDLSVEGCTTAMDALSQDAMPNLKKVSMYANPVEEDADGVAQLNSIFKEIRGEADEARLLLSGDIFE